MSVFRCQCLTNSHPERVYILLVTYKIMSCEMGNRCSCWRSNRKLSVANDEWESFESIYEPNIIDQYIKRSNPHGRSVDVPAVGLGMMRSGLL
jgi:hypothetical protein